MTEKKNKEEKNESPEKAAENKPDSQELKEILQRVQADFENYKKRVEKEKSEFVKLACSGIIRELLPVLDNFEVALKNISNPEDFIKGVEMIYAQLFELLERAGLRQIDAEGKNFNPYVHEALMQEESDKEEGIIIEEFQKGYMINDSVLRHSKVKVSKGKKDAKTEDKK